MCLLYYFSMSNDKSVNYPKKVTIVFTISLKLTSIWMPLSPLLHFVLLAALFVFFLSLLERQINGPNLQFNCSHYSIPLTNSTWKNQKFKKKTSHLYFCSELSSLASTQLVEDNEGTRCGESSSEGCSPSPSQKMSATSQPPPPSLLPFFWKRRENVFRNFCKTLSAVLAPKKRGRFLNNSTHFSSSARKKFLPDIF